MYIDIFLGSKMQFLSLNLHMRMQGNTVILVTSHHWGQEILRRQFCSGLPRCAMWGQYAHRFPWSKEQIVHMKSLHGSQTCRAKYTPWPLLDCHDFSNSLTRKDPLLHSFVYLVKETSGVKSFHFSLRTQSRASQEIQCTFALPWFLEGTVVLPLLDKEKRKKTRKNRRLIMV